MVRGWLDEHRDAPTERAADVSQPVAPNRPQTTAMLVAAAILCVIGVVLLLRIRRARANFASSASTASTDEQPR